MEEKDTGKIDYYPSFLRIRFQRRIKQKRTGYVHMADRDTPQFIHEYFHYASSLTLPFFLHHITLVHLEELRLLLKGLPLAKNRLNVGQSMGSINGYILSFLDLFEGSAYIVEQQTASALNLCRPVSRNEKYTRLGKALHPVAERVEDLCSALFQSDPITALVERNQKPDAHLCTICREKLGDILPDLDFSRDN
jgi:hypothetical protein